MDILTHILNKQNRIRAISAPSFDFDNFQFPAEQEGAFVIYGTGKEMKRFYCKKGFTERSRTFFIKRFALLMGDIDNIITAIPLDSRKVLNSALIALCLAKRPSFKKRFIIGTLRIFNVPFLYPFIFRKQFCLVIDKKMETLYSFLSRGLNVSATQLFFSIYKSSGKFIVPLFNSETGKNIGYAKIYASKKDSENYGKTEARALSFLGRFSFKSAEVPRVLLSNYFGDNLVTVVSSKDGLRNFKGVSNEHIEWIKELAKKTGVKKRFKDSLFAKTIQEEVDFIKTELNKEDFDMVIDFYKEAMEALNEKEFIFSFVNREFDYHELLRDKEKNLVIDWEHARDKFPPLFDVYSLLLSEGPSQYEDYVERQVQDIKLLFFKENKKTKMIILDFLNQWELDGRDAYHFFLLFLVDRLYIFLHMGSWRDSKIITRFLRKMCDNESEYRKSWFND